MRINRIPLLLVVAGGAAVMLITHWIRPMTSFDHPLRWALNLSPNLFTSLCAPFAALIPDTFTRRTAGRLFLGAAALTAGVLLWFELAPPLRTGRPFDAADIAATLLGTGGAWLLSRKVMRS